MVRNMLAGAGFAALMAVASTANSANYNFNVLYYGNGVAALAPGSDDLLGTTILPGDSFVYSLSAQGGGAWNTLVAQQLDRPFALFVGPDGARDGASILELKHQGSTVFSFTPLLTGTFPDTLGPVGVSIGSGLTFDKWVLSETVTSGVDSLALSLLPWPGAAPEIRWAGVISYTPGAAPEPDTWALMIGGLGLAGLALRRGRMVARV